MEEGAIVDRKAQLDSTSKVATYKSPFSTKSAPILEEGRLTGERTTSLNPLSTQQLYATMAKSAYQPARVKEQLESQGWNVDKELSTSRHRVYYNPEVNKAVVASRGTKVNDIHDILTDFAIVGGTEQLTPQFKKTDQVVQETIKRYGKKNVSLTGHSKAGLEVIETGEKYDLPVHSFSPAIMPNKVDIFHPDVAGKLLLNYLSGAKQPKKKIHIYTTGIDPISYYSPMMFDKYNIHLTKPKYHFDTHGIDNFL